MSAEYIESEIPKGDQRTGLLEVLAGGPRVPFVFIVVHSEGDGIGIKADTGGGITSSAEVKKILELALQAMP